MPINFWYNMLGYVQTAGHNVRIRWSFPLYLIIFLAIVSSCRHSPNECESAPDFSEFRFRDRSGFSEIKSNLTSALNSFMLWSISYRQMNETETTIKLSGNVMGHLSNDWSAMADKRKQNQYSSFCDSIAKLHLLIMTAANEEASVTPRATPSELA